MKVLFLSGVYAKENEEEVMGISKGAVDFAANLFQQKIVNGLKSNSVDYTVLSAPFVGAYPNRSTSAFFRGFRNPSEFNTIHFCNIWGIRNLSRAYSLKRSIRSFAEQCGEEKLIIAYSAHTPFLAAAVYAKKIDPTIKICLIVPDLPQYMNLSAKKNSLYSIAKKFDIFRMNKLMEKIDSFVLLTDNMKEPLRVGRRNYIVLEGIVEEGIFEKNKQLKDSFVKDDIQKYIVYTGTTNEKYGIKNLVDAFSLLKDSNFRLVICGRGDSDEYIRQKASADPRILAFGQVSPDVAHQWILKANVLVNPRQNNEEYTKYSFPSKNLEYLSSGNPVVAYMLSGMKESYRDVLIIPKHENINALASSIKIALEGINKSEGFVEYANNCITNTIAVNRIIHMAIKQDRSGKL